MGQTEKVYKGLKSIVFFPLSSSNILAAFPFATNIAIF